MESDPILIGSSPKDSVERRLIRALGNHARITVRSTQSLGGIRFQSDADTESERYEHNFL